jgi:hypothetical protein
MAMLAWIIPVEGGGLTPSHPIVLPPTQPPGIWPSPGHPEHPIVYPPPPGIWPSPGYPAHPIAPGGPPPGIWPSPGHPEHPIYFPPTGIWPSPGHPAHPIAPGGQPPSIWPSPGYPSHPIYWPPSVWPSPGVPTHPIVIPPQPPGGGEGGGEDASATNPINRPPSEDPRWLQVYVPGIGWVWALVPPEGHPPQVNPLKEKVTGESSEA